VRLEPILALIRRDYSYIRSYPLVLSFDIGYGLIDLLIYFFISRTFSGVSSADLQGAPSYFAFVLVGIVITLVISAASAELAQRLREEQFTGTLEILVAQPVTSVEIALGTAGFPFAFAMARGLVYLLVGTTLLGVGLPNADWPGFILIVLATAAALLGIGLLIAAAVIVFKRQAIGGLVSVALGFGGGAFFPLSVLPDWLRHIGELLPTYFIFHGARAALFRGEGWGTDLGALVASAVVLVPLSLIAFSRALEFARRSASLGQY
jgi:ABC-2 type transport system permease protein